MRSVLCLAILLCFAILQRIKQQLANNREWHGSAQVGITADWMVGIVA
jgi:hypothetical protein